MFPQSFIVSCIIISVVKATLPLTAEAMSTARLFSYTSLEDLSRGFNVARLILKRVDIFVDADGVDMVDSIRTTLGLRTRQEAAAYIVAHNHPELRLAMSQILTTTSEPSIAILMSQAVTLVDPLVVRPIINLVAEYRSLVMKPCLTDSLPILFENPEIYYNMFTPVERSTYRVSRNYLADDIIGYLHDEVLQAPWTEFIVSSTNSTVVSLQRRSAIEVDRNQTRIIDLRAGCAVDVNSHFHSAYLLPQLRVLLAWENKPDVLHVWRGDEERIVDIPQRSFNCLDMNGDSVQLVSLSINAEFYSFSTNLEEPFVITRSLVWNTDGDMKIMRTFDNMVINNSVTGLILFSKVAEEYLSNLLHSIRYAGLRHLIVSIGEQSRDILDHLVGGRFIEAWKGFRVLPIGPWLRWCSP